MSQKFKTKLKYMFSEKLDTNLLCLKTIDESVTCTKCVWHLLAKSPAAAGNVPYPGKGVTAVSPTTQRQAGTRWLLKKPQHLLNSWGIFREESVPTTGATEYASTNPFVNNGSPHGATEYSRLMLLVFSLQSEVVVTNKLGTL